MPRLKCGKLLTPCTFSQQQIYAHGTENGASRSDNGNAPKTLRNLGSPAGKHLSTEQQHTKAVLSAVLSVNGFRVRPYLRSKCCFGGIFADISVLNGRTRLRDTRRAPSPLTPTLSAMETLYAIFLVEVWSFPINSWSARRKLLALPTSQAPVTTCSRRECTGLQWIKLQPPSSHLADKKNV